MARKALIQTRRDSAADWSSANPTLAEGEPGFETDTGILKIGDGSTAWNNLQNIFRPDPYTIIGIKIDSSSSNPALTYVDINKNTITLDTVFFDNHPIWSRIRRCTINPTTGVISYGSNARGDGLTLDGTTGDVMVEFPKFYWMREAIGTSLYIWFSPYDYSGFEIHPWFVQRGQYESNMYLGAYGSCLEDDAGTIKLVSKTGEQPMTGGEIWKLSYTSGSTEFTIGETLTGATGGATADVVSYHLASGTWAGGDAAGDVYLKQKSGDYEAEDLNGSVAGANCCSIGAAGSGTSLTIAEAETYSNNKGTGWGASCFWSWHARAILMYADLGTRDAQTALGRGVVDLAAGTGYAGLENGALSADTNIATNGTGTGTGADGETPVVWRGLENPYGGWWEYITGVMTVDGGYQIVNRQGLASAVMPAGTWGGASEYEQSLTAPITADGYVKLYVDSDALLLGLLIPSDTTGSSSTYACDYHLGHTAGRSNIGMIGGTWANALLSGPAYMSHDDANNKNAKDVASRLEYKPQEA